MKPLRQTAIKVEMTEMIKSNPVQLTDITQTGRPEQESLDIEFQLDLKTFMKWEATYAANKCKAFTTMHNCHNKTMQNQITETRKQETNIRNNTFKLLNIIKMKMCRQVHAKYKWTQLTDATIQFITTKQEHGKSLTDFAKQFKQTKDNMKSAVGKGFLNGFIEKTNVYAIDSNVTFRTELTKKSLQVDNMHAIKTRRQQQVWDTKTVTE